MNKPVIFAVLATLAFASEAAAKCEVTQPTGLFNVAVGSSHTETDCASTADTKAALDKKADITYVDSQILIVQGAVDAEKIRNDNQDTTLGEHGAQLKDHEGRIVATEEKNAAQDETLGEHGARITATEEKNAEQDKTLKDHDERITTNTNDIATTNNRLDSFNGTGGSLETWATNTDTHLAAIDQTNFAQDNRLTGLERTSEKHARGIAIAMAMPDTWLSDREKFAFAFNVGGFDDQTAFGAAAIVRFDSHWSGNMKVGADSGFKDLGWTVGAVRFLNRQSSLSSGSGGSCGMGS